MNKTHGLTYHPIYQVWSSLKDRCYNKKSPAYRNYGGRGVSVCKRWLISQNFFDDMLPTYKEGLEIDRIDNNGDYCPTNCQWVTRSQNQRNKRSNILVEFEGRKWVLIELAEKLNIKYITLHRRYIKGKPLGTPLDQSKIRDRKVLNPLPIPD